MKYISRTLFVFLFVIVIASCSKPKDMTPVTPPPPSPATYQQLLADSLFLFAKQIYYWNTSLPDSVTFNPRNYAGNDTLGGLKQELFALTQIPKNPLTNSPYELYQYIDNNGNTVTKSKYSYISKTSDLYGGGAAAFVSDMSGNNLKMTLDGKENGMGFIVGFIPVAFMGKTSAYVKAQYVTAYSKDTIPYTNKDSNVCLIRYVTNQSPAWNAGLRRGDIVAKFNGNAWGSGNSADILNALDGSSLSLTIRRPGNKTTPDTTITINKAQYTFNPVFKDTTLTIKGKKIGYIAYKSFTDWGTNSSAALTASFQKFSGITDIVVDLRYNGGGFVKSAENFADMLAPASANGSVLFAEYYNQTMQSGQAKLLQTQKVYDGNNKPLVPVTYYSDYSYTVSDNTTKVNKQGTVNSANNITNIYFIVSAGTASASELLINSLKPYFTNIYLIGAWFSDNGKKTYGKPIGFFEIRLGQYSVYMSNFETKNAAGTGGYYDGMSTDYQPFDDLRYDFGNPNENCFLQAIRLIIGDNTYLPVSNIYQSPSTIARALSNGNAPTGLCIPVGNPVQMHDMIVKPARH